MNILRLLQKDGRISNKALAARVGLAPSTCLERVRQLRRSGVLRGVHGDVCPEALNAGVEAMYFIELAKHARGVVEAFQAEMQRLPEVRSVYLVAGQYDFLLHVLVRDVQHLRDLALDAITIRPEVTRIETVLIFAHQRNFVLPDYTGLSDGEGE